MRKNVLLGLVLLTASAMADGEMIAAQMKSEMQSLRRTSAYVLPTMNPRSIIGTLSCDGTRNRGRWGRC